MASRISPLSAAMALSTPLPPNLVLSPSRSSTASWAPVEAPEGTAARPKEPSSRSTSTSTVGLPRLSRISRAATLVIAVMMVLSRSVVEQRSASRSDLSDPDVVGVSGNGERDAGGHDHEVVGLGEFLFHRVADSSRHHLLVRTHIVRTNAVRPPEQAETARGREVRRQGQD